MNRPIQPELFDAPREADSHVTQAQLKALLTQVFLDEQPVQRLLKVTELVPQGCRQAWHLVAHTLLARRLDAASRSENGLRGADAHTIAYAMLRQWDQPVMAQRWERLVSQMTAGQCRHLVMRARRRGLAH